MISGRKRNIRGSFRAALAAAAAFALCFVSFTGCIFKRPEPVSDPLPSDTAAPGPTDAPPTETPVPWADGELIYEFYADSGSVRSLGLEVPSVDYSYSVPAFVPSVQDNATLNREILGLFDNYLKAEDKGSYVISSYYAASRRAFTSLSPELIASLEGEHVTASLRWEQIASGGLLRVSVTAERLGPSGGGFTKIQRNYCIDTASHRRLSFDEILSISELTHSDFYTLVCNALAAACSQSWESSPDRALTEEDAQMRTLTANTVSGIAQQGLFVTAEGFLRFLALICDGTGEFEQKLISLDPADKPQPTPEPTEEPTPEPTAEPTEIPSTPEPTAEPGPGPTEQAAYALEFFDYVSGLSADTPRMLSLLASTIPGMELTYFYQDSALRYEKSGLSFGCDLNATEGPALYCTSSDGSLTFFGVGVGTERALAEARLWGFASSAGDDGSVTYDLGDRGSLKLVYSGDTVSSIVYLRYTDQ
jgi:hypothetical protein